MFHFCKKNWWSEFSFDEINHAAQTPQCLETCYMSKHTSFSTHLFIIYMFQNGDWPCLLVNDGVAFFREFRPKTWGPCNKLKFLAWKQTHLTSKCLEMCKTYRSIISVSVARYYRIAWRTDCAVLTIVTMQPAFEPQARNTSLSDFSFKKTNEITSRVVYINTVCAERMIYTIKVVKSKTTLIDSDLCNPAKEPSQTKL